MDSGEQCEGGTIRKSIWVMSRRSRLGSRLRRGGWVSVKEAHEWEDLSGSGTELVR